MTTLNAGFDSVGLPAYTPILTPRGWVQLAELTPGDTVLDTTGHPCVVTDLKGHGLGDTARLRLRDGSALVAGVEQRWAVQVQGRATVTLPTCQVGQLLDSGLRVRLPTPSPSAFTGRDPLPIPAYTLGALLADGGLSSGSSPVLWSNEPEILSAVVGELPPGARLSDRPRRKPRCTGWTIVGARRGAGKNSVMEGLRQLHLDRVRSFEKFVPGRYLWAPVPDRLAILQALLDCDGTVGKDGQISFCSASDRLARDVLFLIRSLGGRAALRVRENVTYRLGPGGGPIPGRPSYRVGSIWLSELPPFRLARKAERVRAVSRTMGSWIAAVEPHGSVPLVSLAVTSPVAAVVAGPDFVPVCTDDTGAAIVAVRAAA